MSNNTNNRNSIEISNPDEKEIVSAFIFLNDGIPYLRRAMNEDLERGKWGVPAGHIDKTDASPLAAMIREANEETKLKVDPDKTIYLGAYRTVAKGPDGAVKEKLLAHAFLVIIPDHFLSDVKINPETHSDKITLHMDDIKAYYVQLIQPLLRGAIKTTMLSIEELATPDIDLIRACFPALKEITTKMALTLTALSFANPKEFNSLKIDKSRVY